MLSHSVLLKRMKLDKRSFGELTDTLIEQGDIEKLVAETGGRKAFYYRLTEGVKKG